MSVPETIITEQNGKLHLFCLVKAACGLTCSGRVDFTLQCIGRNKKSPHQLRALGEHPENGTTRGKFRGIS